jgi:hypothetical protein
MLLGHVLAPNHARLDELNQWSSDALNSFFVVAHFVVATTNSSYNSINALLPLKTFKKNTVTGSDRVICHCYYLVPFCFIATSPISRAMTKYEVEIRTKEDPLHRANGQPRQWKSSPPEDVKRVY